MTTAVIEPPAGGNSFRGHTTSAELTRPRIDGQGAAGCSLCSLFHDELHRLARAYDAANRRALTAGIYDRQGDREAAEGERQQAAGDYYALEAGLADLGLLLLRMMLRRQPEAASALLAQALGPELRPMAEALVRLEGRR